MSELLAVDDFSGANLGDVRRSRRLARIVAQASVTPAGTLTGVFKEEAEREGAYRFFGNEAVNPEELDRASAQRGFSRALGMPYVFVPCDGSTLTLPAVPAESEMGPVGNRWSKDLGVQVMSAILVSPEGVTLGSGGQVYWTRARQEKRSRTRDYQSGQKERRSKRDTQRPIAQKETLHWGTVMEKAMAAAKEAQFQGQLWFQLDAGADFSHLLASATLLAPWVTVRTKNPRSLLLEAGLLMDNVLEAAPVGKTVVRVPASGSRTERQATLELRYSPVILKLSPRGQGGTLPAPLFAVHAREVSPLPKGAEPIDWLLLTNKPGSTQQDALLVVRGYSMRWRIEEVHKTWKSVTNVEDSGLHSLQGFSAWATILFAIAIRIERLKYMSRTQPDAPATVEFEPHELQALQALKNSSRKSKGPITLAVAVRWIADLGGYMNPRKGPPGSIVLARGLLYLRPVAHGLRLAHEM